MRAVSGSKSAWLRRRRRPSPEAGIVLRAPAVSHVAICTTMCNSPSWAVYTTMCVERVGRQAVSPLSSTTHAVLNHAQAGIVFCAPFVSHVATCTTICNLPSWAVYTTMRVVQLGRSALSALPSTTHAVLNYAQNASVHIELYRGRSYAR